VAVASAARNLIVVGQGAAGLAAALAAAEAARAHSRPINVTLADKATQDEAGGNTRWSPSNMRMASTDRVEPSFVHDMLAASNFQGDESYFARLAKEAPATVTWLASHGIEFIQPTYYLAKGPPRIQPAGGGPVLIKELTRGARQAGVVFLNSCVACEIAIKNDRITGLVVEQNGMRQTLAADAIVLACGGFQGNVDMMRAHFGEGAATMRLISPGTRFNTGDGIRMAQRLGADRSGDWNGMHAEPVDARAKNSAPVVLVYPYGIVVDKNGRRFFDEGAGLVHETWEWFARAIHFKAPGSMAYAILDSRLFEIADYQRAIRLNCRRCPLTRSPGWRNSSAWMPTISWRRLRPTMPPAWGTQIVSTRPAATGLRPRKRCSRRSRTGRAPSACRHSSPIRWPARWRTHLVASQPTTTPACCATARQSPASLLPAR
jgi:tricarballylate dehydrogenase